MKQYNQEELAKLKETELCIYEEIVRVCKKFGIKFFSMSGTTIGAVRHEGFIPWDDDIDLGMLRDDYEKFLEVAKEELREGYTLCHYSVDKNYPSYHIKIKMDGTEFIEFPTRKVKTHKGIFVDILPCDRCPENEVEQKKFIEKTKKYETYFRLKSQTEPAEIEGNKLKFVLKKLAKKLMAFLLLGISKKKMFEKLNNHLRKYQSSDNNDIISASAYGFKGKISDIFPTVDMKFETAFMPVPHNYHEALTTEFGDYMTLPPQEKRQNHSPLRLKFIDLSKFKTNEDLDNKRV